MTLAMFENIRYVYIVMFCKCTGMTTDSVLRLKTLWKAVRSKGFWEDMYYALMTTYHLSSILSSLCVFCIAKMTHDFKE